MSENAPVAAGAGEPEVEEMELVEEQEEVEEVEEEGEGQEDDDDDDDDLVVLERDELAALPHDQWVAYIRSHMDAHPSNSLEIARLLSNRCPPFLSADGWERYCINANDFRERMEEMLFEGRQLALEYVPNVERYAKYLMVKRGYEEDGRWAGRGVEPGLPHLPPFEIPKFTGPDGSPFFLGYDAAAYNRAQKGLVERLGYRNSSPSEPLASPKRLAQAVHTGLFHMLLADILVEREEKGLLSCARGTR